MAKSNVCFLRLSSFVLSQFVEFSSEVCKKQHLQKNFVQNLNHYNENLFNTIKQYEEKIRIAGNNLNTKNEKLKADAGVLKKHVSFGYKLKIFSGIYFGK